MTVRCMQSLSVYVHEVCTSLLAWPDSVCLRQGRLHGQRNTVDTENRYIDSVFLGIEICELGIKLCSGVSLSTSLMPMHNG